MGGIIGTLSFDRHDRISGCFLGHGIAPGWRTSAPCPSAQAAHDAAAAIRVRAA